MAYGAFTLDLVGQAVPTNGGLGEIVNREDQDVIVTGAWLLVDTPSAGAANAAIGVGAAGAANANLIAAQALNGILGGTAYNLQAPAAGAACVVWPAGQVLNATGSAACAAFRGRVYIEYQRTQDEE